MDLLNLSLLAEDIVPVLDEKGWSYVVAVVFTGLAVVFLALVILIVFVWLMGTIFKAAENSRKKKKANGVSFTPEPSEQRAAPAVKHEAVSSDDDEVIAVISAAVAAMGQADGKNYRLRSVKPAGGRASRSAWSMAGLQSDTAPF